MWWPQKSLLVLWSWSWCFLQPTGGHGIDGPIMERNALPARYKKVACPGFGPFASLNECFITCEDAKCSNGIMSCDMLSIDCDALVRSSHGLNLDLTGQLVELVSFFSVDSIGDDEYSDYEEETSQHKRSCFEYGQQLANTSVGKLISSHGAMNAKARSRFTSGKGTIMFLHLRKAGGRL